MKSAVSIAASMACFFWLNETFAQEPTTIAEGCERHEDRQRYTFGYRSRHAAMQHRWNAWAERYGDEACNHMESFLAPYAAAKTQNRDLAPCHSKGLVAARDDFTADKQAYCEEMRLDRCEIVAKEQGASIGQELCEVLVAGDPAPEEPPRAVGLECDDFSLRSCMATFVTHVWLRGDCYDVLVSAYDEERIFTLAQRVCEP